MPTWIKEVVMQTTNPPNSPYFDLLPFTSPATGPFQWVDVPGVSLTLPQGGDYALDFDVHGLLDASPPNHSWIGARLVSITPSQQGSFTVVPYSELWVGTIADLRTSPNGGSVVMDQTASRSVNLKGATASTTVQLQVFLTVDAQLSGMNRAMILSNDQENYGYGRTGLRGLLV